MGLKTIGRFLLATALIGAGVLLLTQYVLAGLEQDSLQLTTPYSRMLAMLVIAGTIFIGGVAMYPIAVAVIVGAALLGPIVAVATMSGTMLGALFGWYLGRRYGEQAVRRFSKEAVEKLFRLVERHAVLSSLLVRWIPGLPFALQNAGMGAAGAPLGPYLLGTALGVTVTHAAMIFAGIAAGEVVMHLRKSVTMGWIGIAVVFIGGCVVLFLARRQPQETAQS